MNYRKYSLILAVFLSQICISLQTSEPITTFSACDEQNRPESCDDIYQPVCGFGLSKPQTFSNGCSACSNSQIYGYEEKGECTEEQLNQAQNQEEDMGKCDGEDRNQSCPEIFIGDGICGHFATADGEGNMKQIFGTECQACSDSKVVFWVRGSCNKDGESENTNQAQLLSFIIYTIAFLSMLLI